MPDFTDTYILDLDKSLEIAQLIRASESGYARDNRNGAAFDYEGDRKRLDAYTFGLFDGLAHKIGHHETSIRLLTYLHKLADLGPGETTRWGFMQMHALSTEPELARYVSGGRYHVVKMLSGNPPAVGAFARLIDNELAEG